MCKVRDEDFFAANALPPMSPLKMDMEGYKAKALPGMRETIWRDRPPSSLRSSTITTPALARIKDPP